MPHIDCTTQFTVLCVLVCGRHATGTYTKQLYQYISRLIVEHTKRHIVVYGAFQQAKRVTGVRPLCICVIQV